MTGLPAFEQNYVKAAATCLGTLACQAWAWHIGIIPKCSTVPSCKCMHLPFHLLWADLVPAETQCGMEMLVRAASSQLQTSSHQLNNWSERVVGPVLVSEEAVTFLSVSAIVALARQPLSDAQFIQAELRNTAASPRNASHSCSGCARASARPSQ